MLDPYAQVPDGRADPGNAHSNKTDIKDKPARGSDPSQRSILAANIG